MSEKEVTLLHELKKGSKIHAYTNRSKTKKEVVTFDHIDGMYSYCTLPDGTIVHLSAVTPLKKVGEHYEIVYDREEDEK